MNSDDVPDDIWINICELIEGSAQLAALVRTSHRFQELGTKLLLRELCWVDADSTANNIDAWKGYNDDMSSLPRKMILCVAFDFSGYKALVSLTSQMKLHDAIYAQVLLFKNLHEIVLNGTVVSHFTHKILGLIPTLRVLIITGCKFIDLGTPFAQYNQSSISADSQTHSLSITHLSLHDLDLPDPNSGSNQIKYNQFLRFNNISTLSSLSLTWTPEFTIAFTMFSEKFLEDDESWLFPNLAHLDVLIPLLNVLGALPSIFWFAKGYCPLRPRIRISIEKNYLSEQRIRGLRVRTSGLWSYVGPLQILLQFRILTDLTHVVIKEPMEKVLDKLRKLPETLQSLDIMVKGWEDGLVLAIEIQDMFPTIRFMSARYSDARRFLLFDSETLEVEVPEWDKEVLFTIRYRFPTIRSVAIQYGRNAIKLDHRFIVRLGCDILFNLPHLNMLKLFHDVFCVQAVSPTRHDFHSIPSIDCSNDNDDSEQQPNAVCEDDVKDYLNAWNRYCTQLRHFQLTKDRYWVRRFDGDQWVKMVSV